MVGSGYGGRRARVAHDHRVVAKMRVADLLSVGGVDDGEGWQRAVSGTNAKHVVFVVCRSDTLEVVAAVELDADGVRASALGAGPNSADERAAGAVRAGADDVLYAT
jgi:hypothetical protein